MYHCIGFPILVIYILMTSNIFGFVYSLVCFLLTTLYILMQVAPCCRYHKSNYINKGVLMF